MQLLSELEWADEMTDDVTVGEVSRRLTDLRDTVLTQHRALDDRMTDHMVSRDFYDGRHQALVERIRALEEARVRDASRRGALTVAVIAALIGAAASGITAVITAAVH